MAHHISEDEAAFAREFPRAHAALGYAGRGWRVLPVHWINDFNRCTCLPHGHDTCASAGKHPVANAWPDDATTDHQEIILTWGESPEANIGIATGITSGIFVVDVDEGIRPDGTYKQGLESKIDLEDVYDEFPETYAVTTGGGGTQYYFRMPDGYMIKNAVKVFGDDFPDIDMRGDGGMVVAPPSVSGRGPYTVEQDGEVAEPPQWMLDLLLRHGVMEPLEGPEDPHPDASSTPAPAAVVAPSPPPAWLESSLAAKADAIRTAAPGTANVTNNRMAYMIGQYIPHGWISLEDAETRLTEAAAKRVCPNAEAVFTIKRALREGAQHPYQTLDQVAATGDLSDAIMAERVAGELLAGEFCWVFGMDWLAWDRRVWKMCPDVQVIEIIRKHMIAEVRSALPGAANNATARRALAGLLSKSRINSIMLLTRGVLQVDASVFDQYPDLLNTPGGVVDLTTGEIIPHDPYLYMTKITDVAYRPGAVHPDWETALEAVPEEVIDWLKIRLGQSITGYTPFDDSMILMHGTGANGKTTLLNTISHVIGTYYATVPSTALIGKTDDPHALMPFMGARLAVVEELPEGRRLNVNRLKDTVGTPRMQGRYMYKNPVEWDASHQLVITTNYIPSVAETDGGSWRRLRMVTFPFRYVRPGKVLESANDRRGDPKLRYRLQTGTEQREACLAWLIDGARMWYEADKDMPDDPERVSEDTEAWRESADLILSYWRQRIEPAVGGQVLKTDLYADFRSVIEAAGHSGGWSDRLFYDRFENHEETIRHKVVKGKVAVDPDRITRPAHQAWANQEVTGQKWLYHGVRFVNG
jgi:P4 family phage/plasmid primase-like protien